MHRHPTFKADFDTGDMEVQETNSASADHGGGGLQQQHDPSLRVFEEEESVYVDSKRMHRLPPIPASALPPLMPPAPPFPTASSEMVASNRPMNLNYTKPSDGTMFSLNSNSQDAGSASQSASASQSRSQSASQSQSQSASSPYDSVPVYAVVATPVDEMADMSTLGHERRKNRKIMTCLVVSLLLVIGLAVAVGLLVSNSKKKAARAAAGNANAISSSDGGGGDGGDQVGRTGDATDPAPTGAPHNPLFFGDEEDDTPTTSPVASPSFSPTTTRVPTLSPTRRPTHAPNFVRVPTVEPTGSPTREPTREPSATPTRRPTRKPTPAPVPVTEPPTYAPVAGPTTGRPTRSPTTSPTRKPTINPTRAPTRAPTKNPTKAPSRSPVEDPTTEPPTEGQEEEQVVTDEPTPAPVPVVVDTEEPTQSPVAEPPPPDTDSPVASPPATDAPVASPPPPEETAPPDTTPPPTALIVNRMPPNPNMQLQTSFNVFDEKKSKAGNIFIAEAVKGGVSVNGVAVHVSTPAGDNVAISVWTAYAANVGDLDKIKNPDRWTQVVAKEVVRSSGPRNGTPVPFKASSAVKICPGKGVAFYVLAEAAASQGGKKGKAAKPKLLSTPSKLFVSSNQVKNDQLMVHAGVATDGKKASKERVMWNGEMRYAPALCP